MQGYGEKEEKLAKMLKRHGGQQSIHRESEA
jgi:hypothetical protein